MYESYVVILAQVDVTVGLHNQRAKKKLKKRFGVSDATNPILDLCVDANQSTPFEALHILLLGLYKCESFNSIIRAKNIFSNKHSPSKDIATNFGVEESIRNICSGISDKFGAELVELYKSDVVSEYMYLGKHVESEKCIYQQGTLRKLSTAALELGAIKMTIPERGTILLSQAIASCTLLMPPS
ncbi:hypothetical protein EMCRGX_G026414 [Ephydatia muelleri]